MTAPPNLCATVRELPADIERLYNGGLYRQAAEALNVAIQREPQEALVLGNQAPAEAEKDLHHYLNTVPDNDNVPSHSTAHEWLGRFYEREGHFDMAAQEYQAALTLDPRNKQAREGLKALQKSGSAPGARF